MIALLALAALAAAASAGLSPLPLLALLSLALLASGYAGRDPDPATTQQGEEVIATIYLRAGKLVLRRRTP